MLEVENARCAAREGAAEARRAPTTAPNFQEKSPDLIYTYTIGSSSIHFVCCRLPLFLCTPPQEQVACTVNLPERETCRVQPLQCLLHSQYSHFILPVYFFMEVACETA